MKQIARLRSSEFAKFSQFVEKEMGIQLPESKAPMLEGRLARRLRALELGSATEY